MKKVVALIALGCIVHSSITRAGEIETAVAKSAVSTYAQIQIRDQLTTYLNKNPSLLGSSDQTIGTQSMKFVGQALAMYGLVTAKTDRERMWAASSLLLTPEPMTCAILIGAQLVDTLMTMRAQRDLARVFEKIAEIQAETSKALIAVATVDFERQRRLAERFLKKVKTTRDLYNQVMQEPLARHIQDENSHVAIDSENVVQTLNELIQLRETLLDLDSAAYATRLIGLNALQAMGLESDFALEANKTSTALDAIRTQIENLRTAVFHFYGSLEAEKLKTQIRAELSPYAMRLRRYQYCVRVINTAKTEAEFDQSNEWLTENDVRDCETRNQAGARL